MNKLPLFPIKIRPFKLLDDCSGYCYGYYSCQLVRYDYTKPKPKNRQSFKRLKQILEWSKYHLTTKSTINLINSIERG
jgi:hypothetical protein